MWRDPIVEEIRLESELYAQQFDFDLHAIFNDLKKREQTSGRQVVSFRDFDQMRRVKPHSMTSGNY